MYEGLNFVLYKMSFVRGLNFLHFPLLHHTYILSFKVILFSGGEEYSLFLMQLFYCYSWHTSI